MRANETERAEEGVPMARDADVAASAGLGGFRNVAGSTIENRVVGAFQHHDGKVQARDRQLTQGIAAMRLASGCVGLLQLSLRSTLRDVGLPVDKRYVA